LTVVVLSICDQSFWLKSYYNQCFDHLISMHLKRNSWSSIKWYSRPLPYIMSFKFFTNERTTFQEFVSGSDIGMNSIILFNFCIFMKEVGKLFFTVLLFAPPGTTFYHHHSSHQSYSPFLEIMTFHHLNPL